MILQDDRFDTTDSITICAFTTDPTDAPLIRLSEEPSESNGLRTRCRMMVDKITTIPKSKIGARVGRLADEDVVRLNRAVVVFLGIAAPSNREVPYPSISSLTSARRQAERVRYRGLPGFLTVSESGDWTKSRTSGWRQSSSSR